MRVMVGYVDDFSEGDDISCNQNEGEAMYLGQPVILWIALRMRENRTRSCSRRTELP